MSRKTVSGIMLVLLVMSILVLTVETRHVQASGTIYIRADGSIDPPIAPIQYIVTGPLVNPYARYTLTGNITTYGDGVVIEPSYQARSLVLDGDGYSIEGTGLGRGISLSGVTSLEIMNVEIRGFAVGIYIESSQNDRISATNITNNGCAISMYRSSGNSIFANTIADNQLNTGVGIMLWNSSGNRIYRNNFLNNTVQIYDYSQTSQSIPQSINEWDRNYWGDYGGNDANADGIGDTQYRIDSNNVDDRPLMSDRKLSPGYYDTSSFLMGSVAVGVIFAQSNGAIDPSTENWTEAQESTIVADIDKALGWWEGYNPYARLSFSMEVHYRVPTSYEPISHSLADTGLWIPDVIRNLGYESTLDYVNDLRDRLRTDWSLVIFMVASSNDADGLFANGYGPHEPVGGPYIIHPYGRLYVGDTWYASIAHGIGHTFYGTDEYNGIIEYSGYLNVSDKNTRDCIMGCVQDASGRYPKPCDSAAGQLGWTDTDANGIPDIIDTIPKITIHLGSNQSSENALTLTGFVTDSPLPNRNPYDPRACGSVDFYLPLMHRSITINTITSVEYKVDSGSWMNATATDGTFDDAQENFTFKIPALPSGTHIVEVRGTNSVGNSKTVNMTYELSASTLNRNYDVIVKDTHGNIAPDVNLTLKSTDNMVLWNSSTDIQGKADFNLTFTDNNYTDTLTLEAVKQGLFAAKNITFISDTPIILSLIIALPGDINGDFHVSLADLVILAQAYGSHSGSAKWNPNADIDGNGAVGLSDLVTLAQHYGQHYP